MSEDIISTSVMVSCVREAGVKRGVWRAQVFDPVTVTVRQEGVKECVPGKTTFGEKSCFLLHPVVVPPIRIQQVARAMWTAGRFPPLASATTAPQTSSEFGKCFSFSDALWSLNRFSPGAARTSVPAPSPTRTPTSLPSQTLFGALPRSPARPDSCSRTRTVW